MTIVSPRAGAVGRRRALLLVFFCLMISLVARSVYLQIFNYKFLRGQGQARQNRVVSIPAHRGSIFDRNGVPLAISTPIDTIWAVPDELIDEKESWDGLAKLLGYTRNRFEALLQDSIQKNRDFLYLRRHVTPDIAEGVRSLNVTGVGVQREYARFYPSGDAAAHIVGFTNIDDKGMEGLELSYDKHWLKGERGKRHIVRDLNKREIESLEVIQAAKPGKDLYLSIDKRLQYLAYTALKSAIEVQKASSASLMVMDVDTGEILAMANAPSYNPNSAIDRAQAIKRNRAVIDQFEPGSTMKPFTIAAALESGLFTTQDIVYTSPGYYRIGKYDVRDSKDYGWLTLKGILKKSSNVGVTKVAQKLQEDQMWSVFDRFGFGRPPGSEFPGEVSGLLNHSSLWNDVEQSALSYGYGMSASVLQLTRAYSAIANGGILPEVSFIRRSKVLPGERVISEKVAQQVITMLESVVTKGGTGTRAKVAGYRVAGKTGTSYKSYSGGYDEERYISLFAGMAPASDPKLVLVVVVHEPTAGDHYGGLVAAPVFSKVMADALRIMGLKRDDWDSLSAQVHNNIVSSAVGAL